MATQAPHLTLKPQPKLLPRVTQTKLTRLRTQMLVRLRLRSQCCGGRIVAWHHDKFYCASCDGWLHRPRG